MKIQQNYPAPDVALTTLTGESAALSTFWRERRATLVIFLRHLA